METISITSLRKELYKIMERVITLNEPITVSTKNGNSVIMSEQDYNSLQETVYLLSQPGLLESIKEGEKEDLSQMKVYNPKKGL